jgi:hypothetical protein
VGVNVAVGLGVNVAVAVAVAVGVGDGANRLFSSKRVSLTVFSVPDTFLSQ